METANQLLAEIQKVKALRKDAPGRQAQRPGRVAPPRIEQPPQQPPTPAQMYGQDTRPSIEGLSSAMENVQITPFEQQQQRPPAQGPSGQFYSQPATGAPAYPYAPGEGPQQPGRIPPGARVPEQPVPYADSQPGRYTPAPPDGYSPGGFITVC